MPFLNGGKWLTFSGDFPQFSVMYRRRSVISVFIDLPLRSRVGHYVISLWCAGRLLFVGEWLYPGV